MSRPGKHPADASLADSTRGWLPISSARWPPVSPGTRHWCRTLAPAVICGECFRAREFDEFFPAREMEAIAEFHVPMSWTTPFGRVRSHTATFRAVLEPGDGGWRVVAIRAVGKID